MQTRPMPIWTGGISPASDHHRTAKEPPRMNIHGYGRKNSGCAIWDTRAAILTPCTAGPKEPACCGGRVTAGPPQPSVSYGVVQQQQQPEVTALHNIPPLRTAYNQCPGSQKGQSRRPVTEENGSAQKRYGHMESGEGDDPGSGRGHRSPKGYNPLEGYNPPKGYITLQRVLANSGPEEATGHRSQDHLLVQTVSTSSTSRGGRSSHRPALHPAVLEHQAVSNKDRFTDAHLHQFVADRAHCLSSRPCKQGTASFTLKLDYTAPLLYTSSAVGFLYSPENAGSPALNHAGNKQLSSAFGKRIPEDAELTRNAEKQDGRAKSAPKNDSTEYPQIMMSTAAVCAKSDNENPVVLSSREITREAVLVRDPASEVRNSVTQEYRSSWLNVNERLDKEPGAEWTNTKTKMDTADSINMSNAIQEASWLKSQQYEDISDNEFPNGTDLSRDVQSNTLLSETTRGNSSGTSSYDAQIDEDAEISTDECLILDEIVEKRQNQPLKQPTTKDDETQTETGNQIGPNGRMNFQNNKGLGFDNCCLSSATPGDSDVICISSDEELSTEGDVRTTCEMQDDGTEAVSLNVGAGSNFPQKHNTTSQVPLRMRSCNSPHIEELDVDATKESQYDGEVESAVEDCLVVPVSIPYLRCEKVGGSHASPAKTKSIKHIPPLPSTTKTPLPASVFIELEVFDSVPSFLQAKTCQSSCISPDFPILELMEGNRIPTKPSNGNLVHRSSSCDTEDSCDYSPQSSHNRLTVSSKCWETGKKSLKRRKKNFHCAKFSLITMSDSTVDSEDEVQEGLTTIATSEAAKSSPIESDKDNERPVEFKNAPTKSKGQTNILKGLHRITTTGAKLRKRKAKPLSFSESEDLPVQLLTKRPLEEDPRRRVKGTLQTRAPDAVVAQEQGRAEQRVPNPNCGLPEHGVIIPRLIYQMPSDQSEPLKLERESTILKNKKDNSTLSKENKKSSHGNMVNRRPINKMNEMKDEKRKMLDCSTGEQRIDALNTRYNVASSKPTSLSKKHLITPKQLVSKAVQKGGHSTASTEPSRAASSSGTEPSRVTSSSEHATTSLMEISPTGMLSRCLLTPRQRISHYTKEPRTASSREVIPCSAKSREVIPCSANSREVIPCSANKSKDSKRKPKTQRDPSPASKPKDGRSEPGPNVSRQKHNSCAVAATPLMRKAMSQAKQLRGAKAPDRPPERRPSVGDGYKWGESGKKK